ncbi:DUF6391 domain-containing protein [Laspinema olomoucense]|uniref:DUF6391 domain-containing protein n=1 Tax=Laspinema olomoucense D3b TaxID=2953688 RepID=A0ABT2NFR3_9CYAN|nr:MULTISPECIES: DUF6391 domain-containing protein [unclassified Laspinema]MCT7981549.1 DUF6391 domain-containing protein [Laspinema sp. D3b]MCT7997420.1 DUF6391 domain-containing protein [Laspinema sp. D3c]
MTATSSQANPFPFDFAPHPTGDAELLQQLAFIPGLKETLAVRQVHALEHATVWVLSETSGERAPQNSQPGRSLDNDGLGGMSTDRGFYLYGQVNLLDLRRAVHVAHDRLTRGEWDLALHPRCGTNLSVGMLITAGLAFGITMVLPRDPISQLLGLGVAATAASQVTPDLGILAQRYLTTAIPYNLAIEEVTPTQDMWGRSAHFIGVRWIE